MGYSDPRHWILPSALIELGMDSLMSRITNISNRTSASSLGVRYRRRFY